MSENDEIVIGGDAADIPDGIYAAKVDRIEVMHSKAFGSDFRAWTFTLDNGSEVSGSTSMNTGSKSKGGRWIKALLGKTPKQGDKVKLVGLPCQVRVEQDAGGWPRVTDVLPAAAAAGTVEDTSKVPADLPF